MKLPFILLLFLLLLLLIVKVEELLFPLLRKGDKTFVLSKSVTVFDVIIAIINIILTNSKQKKGREQKQIKKGNSQIIFHFNTLAKKETNKI